MNYFYPLLWFSQGHEGYPIIDSEFLELLFLLSKISERKFEALESSSGHGIDDWAGPRRSDGPRGINRRRFTINL